MSRPVPVLDGRPGRSLPVISLFSGALGLDLGLEAAGFDIRVAVEPNRWAADTVEMNRPDIVVLRSKIEDLSTQDILHAAGLRAGEPMVVSAGPSCQSFSTAGRRRSLDDPRGTLFREFLRVVAEARPRFFVMEQVRGVLSAAVRHRPLALRGPGHPPLAPDEQLGSAFRLILDELSASDYYTVFNLVNVADYGVAQTRARVLFIGSRDGEGVRLPLPTHSESGGDLVPWRTLADVIGGLEEDKPVTVPLSEAKLSFLKQIPPGGNWRSLPDGLHEAALGKAFVSWGGRSGFYRRLAWDSPAPALTTRPDSKGTMFAHPTEARVLTVGEYAAIQGFPERYRFAGGPANQYLQIGNAVPPPIGRAIGEALVDVISKHKRSAPERRGVVACESAELLRRMAARPRTIVNPPRMRKVQGLSEVREWMQGMGGAREPLDIPVLPPRKAA